MEVVIHSYRHRYGLVSGDPALSRLDHALAAQAPIAVPTIAVDGGVDGVTPPREMADHARHFAGRFRHRLLPHIGHNLPQEAPDDFANAVLALHAAATG